MTMHERKWLFRISDMTHEELVTWKGVKDAVQRMKMPSKLPSLKLTAKAPANRPSQKESNIPTIHLKVLC